MKALTFDKNELGNLEYSLQREMLATDRRGGYMSTTIVGCNTRKYHGLIVAPIDDTDRDFVLLSSLDETIAYEDQRFNLALHRFRGVYEPRGHKYITDFAYTPTPTITYRVADVVLRKELLWIHKRTQLMVRYTILEGAVEHPITLQLRPFLAFRDRHSLSKANMYADGHSYPIFNGVKCRLYDGFPWLNMQTSDVNAEFVQAPDWYYDFEYQRDINRGYDGYEDLLTPGYFELELSAGQSVVFSASVDECDSVEQIISTYESSIARRTHKVDFLSCLHHSARQFLVRRSDKRVEVVAGYPWYSVVGREEMFALAGLTLEQNYKEDTIAVLDSFKAQYEAGTTRDTYYIENAVDAKLWFFRTLQRLEEQVSRQQIWESYGSVMQNILEEYRRGVYGRVELRESGLLWSWCNDWSITWMDTTLDSEGVALRNGYQVEVNALWYNALCYTLELAREHGAVSFVEAWQDVPERAKESFNKMFWLEDRGYLADYVNDTTVNCELRPNMIVACALPYKMINEVQVIDIIRMVEQHLLTPRGLRTLSPVSNYFEHTFAGTQRRRIASKNGTVWVWPLAMYVRACFEIMGVEFLPKAIAILEEFKTDIQSYGIGSVGEYYEANPPYSPRGAVSSAWSVAALLEIVEMCTKYHESASKSPKTRARKIAKVITDTIMPAKKPAAKKCAAKTTATKKPATKRVKKEE